MDGGEARPAPHPHLHSLPAEMPSRTCGTLQLRSRRSEKSHDESRSSHANLVYLMIVSDFEGQLTQKHLL